jgi:hypothetical protein
MGHYQRTLVLSTVFKKAPTGDVTGIIYGDLMESIGDALAAAATLTPLEVPLPVSAPG